MGDKERLPASLNGKLISIKNAEKTLASVRIADEVSDEILSNDEFTDFIKD